VGTFEQHEVVDSGALEVDRHAKAGEASADDRDSHIRVAHLPAPASGIRKNRPIKLHACSLHVTLASRAIPSPAPTPSDATGPTRRRYAPRLPPEQRREQLLDAALSVILELGYSGVSIEAVARTAGVTRPVVYDHFPNLGRLLHTLVEREERYALTQLEDVVPADAGEGDPAELLVGGVKRFLDAVASRPATWRIILLPPDGTPAIVRQHVETNRAQTLARIEQVVQRAFERQHAPDELDIELTARAIRDLAEEAGRMVLTDPERYPPERYERFVDTVLGLAWPRG
jgi:AcrR family transcriptional regulator